MNLNKIVRSIYRPIHCSNSFRIFELSVKFESQICYENINKPLDDAYLADFGIDIKLSMMYIVSGFLSKSMDELKREIFWRHWVLWDIVSDPFIRPSIQAGEMTRLNYIRRRERERSDLPAQPAPSQPATYHPCYKLSDLLTEEYHLCSSPIYYTQLQQRYRTKNTYQLHCISSWSKSNYRVAPFAFIFASIACSVPYRTKQSEKCCSMFGKYWIEHLEKHISCIDPFWNLGLKEILHVITPSPSKETICFFLDL